MTVNCDVKCTICGAMPDQAHAAGCPRQIPELNGKSATSGRPNGPTRWDRHPKRILEIHYDDLIADPVAFVTRVHEAAGIPASGEHLDRVRAHLHHRPRHHFGRHGYSIEDYGLAEDDVRTRLADYDRRVASIPRITNLVPPAS